MTTSSTSTASRPVAAWTSSPGAPSEPMNQTAANHVSTVKPKARPAPAATGRRRAWLAPRKLAVTAASTSTASSPSRRTSSPLSRITAPWLRCWLSVGSGTPPRAVSAA